MRSRALSLFIVLVVPMAITAFTLGGSGRSVPPAVAEVVRLGGFRATVDGHEGWFGTYEVGGIGTTWCVDHGIVAPDADFGYVPTELAEASLPTRTAMAWALGRHGTGLDPGHVPDRVTAAAVMLVLHDLMGARYSSGRLDLGRLAAGQLRGFEGNEPGLLAQAEAIKADALGHAHLRGPLALNATVEAADGGVVKAGRGGVLVARLTDAVGAGVAGVDLTATATGATLTPGAAAPTDARGEQRFAFVAAAGENRFTVAGVAPDLRLQSFAPSARRAQRVARPAQVPVSAGASVEAQTRRLSIRKSGDASAYLPVAGARFQVRPVAGSGASGAPVGELVTGADGTSPTLQLDPGTYEVTEVEAPAGYATAGPWTVDLTTTDVELRAADSALRGTAQVTKVDATTGRALAGAVLSLSYDADHDGAFEAPVDRWVSGVEPAVRELRPGDYELREVTAPEGYRPAEQPVRFSVAPGQVVPVAVANAPLPVTAPPPPSPPSPSPVPPAPSLQRVVREQPPVPHLPETGQPLSLLVGVAIALVTSGFCLRVAGNHLEGRVRDRARSLTRSPCLPGSGR
jgi:Prealbumin-like fold domain